MSSIYAAVEIATALKHSGIHWRRSLFVNTMYYQNIKLLLINAASNLCDQLMNKQGLRTWEVCRTDATPMQWCHIDAYWHHTGTILMPHQWCHIDAKLLLTPYWYYTDATQCGYSAYYHWSQTFWLHKQLLLFSKCMYIIVEQWSHFFLGLSEMAPKCHKTGNAGHKRSWRPQ